MGNRIRETLPDRIFIFCNYMLLSLFLLIVAYPLIFVCSASISDPNIVNAGGMLLLPRDITFEGYRRVFQEERLWMGYGNTIWYTLLGTSINLIVTLPAAYALSRQDFFGRGFFTVLFTITMFFSGGLIPTYLLIKDLGMLDTVWALVLPGACAMWNIVISRTFFSSNIPYELKEAAEIDGCSNTRLFLLIILPLSLPIIAVMGLFYAVGHWNSYFPALIYLSDNKKYPLQLILREILIQNQMSMSMMRNEGGDSELMARQARIAEQLKYGVIIVATLPVLLMYPFLQKYFVHGMMVGSIKG